MQPDPLRLNRAQKGALDRMGQEFLAEILGQETRRRPHNLPALADLAHVLTRLGRLEEGLAADRQLARLAPADPTVRYNLACSLALMGRVDEALEALEKAVELGYEDVLHLQGDGDLTSLRGEGRFQALVRALEARVAG